MIDEELRWWVLHAELLPAPFRPLLFRLEEEGYLRDRESNKRAEALDKAAAKAIAKKK